ncbi:MAG: PAS domain S-box protein [Thermodesulfobacteriota bacterium]
MAEKPQSGSSRILLMAEAAGEALAERLRRLGYGAGLVVCPGREALERALGDRPDLVLLDPAAGSGSDGLETARRLYRDHHVPVVFLCSRWDEALLDQALSACPFGCLLSPFEDVELRTLLEIALMRLETETTLREGEARFRAVVEDQTELICRFTPERTLTFVNQAYCRYCRRSPEELLGRSFLSLVPEEDRTAVQALLYSLGPDRPVGLIEHRVLRPEGETAWQQWTHRGILDRQARLVEYQAVGRDITELKKVEEELRRAREELEARVEKRTLDLLKANLALKSEIKERQAAERHIQSLTQELIKAQENERLRISRDLHDNLAQDLSSIKIALETLFDHEASIPPALGAKVARLSALLGRTVRNVRDLSYDLRPPGLEQLGLLRTIFELCQEFADDNGLRLNFFSVGAESLDLDYHTQINLYRIFQEALNNVKKHARARLLIVRLTASWPHLIIRIEDDGRGFDLKERLAAAEKSKHMGFRNMKERVKLINGKMWIQSYPEKGTRVSIKIPIRGSGGGGKKDHSVD